MLVLAAAGASADRIIFAPTGTKLLNHQVRLEYFSQFRHNDRYDSYLGVGVTKDIEAELVLNRFASDATLGTMNVSYQFTPPLVDTAPGLSFGAQDIMDRTPDGRMYYVAFTYRVGLDGTYNSRSPLELTVGGGFGRRSGLFAGVQIPFTWQFRFLAEHDTKRVTAGVEYRTSWGLALRAAWRQDQTFLGARYTMRF